MSDIGNLKKAIEEWDKMESASSIYYMFGWGKKKEDQKEETEQKLSEENEPDYRDKTHGDRNAKHLMKARIYANTPQAKLKKERTLWKKELES